MSFVSGGMNRGLDCCGVSFFPFLGCNKYKMKCVDEVRRNRRREEGGGGAEKGRKPEGMEVFVKVCCYQERVEDA